MYVLNMKYIKFLFTFNDRTCSDVINVISVCGIIKALLKNMIIKINVTLDKCNYYFQKARLEINCESRCVLNL